jgi:endonuclease III related protein
VSPRDGLLLDAHELLLAYYDVDRWHWQEDSSAFDICVGAILVQHTSWTNVEKALSNLTAAGIDSMPAVAALGEDELASLVRPCGTPSVKARRLRVFAELVAARGGFAGLFSMPTPELREVLLATYGIGPETADVILLYAARRPVIVHDAYTARLCRRLGLGPEGNTYDTWRQWLDARLPGDLDFRRRSHAAIVIHCKETCRVKPRCEVCPLAHICEFNGGGNATNKASSVQETP